MKYRNKGFTIPELMIVIGVLAILVLITAVSYTAILARSKASRAITLADQVARKADGWHSVTGIYPTYTQLSTGKINAADSTQTGPIEARIDDPSALFDAATAQPTDEKRVGYRLCTTGAQVEYYNTVINQVVYIGIDGASSSAACT